MATDDRDSFAELCLICAAILLGGSTGRSVARALDLAWWWELAVTVGVVALVALAGVVLLVLLARRGLLAPRPAEPTERRSRSWRSAEFLGLVEARGTRRRIRWTPTRVGILAAVVVVTGVLAGLVRVGVDRVLV